MFNKKERLKLTMNEGISRHGSVFVGLTYANISQQFSPQNWHIKWSSKWEITILGIHPAGVGRSCFLGSVSHHLNERNSCWRLHPLFCWSNSMIILIFILILIHELFPKVYGYINGYIHVQSCTLSMAIPSSKNTHINRYISMIPYIKWLFHPNGPWYQNTHGKIPISIVV